MTFGKRNYPPNGWNCRFRVDSYSKEDLEEFGFKESTNARALNIAHKDWDYDTRNLDNSIAPLQKIIENKLQLYEKKHLPNAVKALRALKERLIENEARYKAVKGLWDKATKLTMQEASGKAGREFIKIATASDELKCARRKHK